MGRIVLTVYWFQMHKRMVISQVLLQEWNRWNEYISQRNWIVWLTSEPMCPTMTICLLESLGSSLWGSMTQQPQSGDKGLENAWRATDPESEVSKDWKQQQQQRQQQPWHKHTYHQKVFFPWISLKPGQLLEVASQSSVGSSLLSQSRDILKHAQSCVCWLQIQSVDNQD